mmetsp:Transcript_15911/g.34508  ORF Transcript_15911/g.34508 Transcript_15911/m.34508 type:complete len:226 (-) Transcript_15911:17-694(-)
MQSKAMHARMPYTDAPFMALCPNETLPKDILDPRVDLRQARSFVGHPQGTLPFPTQSGQSRIQLFRGLVAILGARGLSIQQQIRIAQSHHGVFQVGGNQEVVGVGLSLEKANDGSSFFGGGGIFDCLQDKAKDDLVLVITVVIIVVLVVQQVFGPFRSTPEGDLECRRCSAAGLKRLDSFRHIPCEFASVNNYDLCYHLFCCAVCCSIVRSFIAVVLLYSNSTER